MSWREDRELNVIEASVFLLYTGLWERASHTHTEKPCYITWQLPFLTFQSSTFTQYQGLYDLSLRTDPLTPICDFVTQRKAMFTQTDVCQVTRLPYCSSLIGWLLVCWATGHKSDCKLFVLPLKIRFYSVYLMINMNIFRKKA